MDDIILKPRLKAIAPVLSAVITRGFAGMPGSTRLNMIFDQLRVFGEPDFLAAYIDKLWIVSLE